MFPDFAEVGMALFTPILGTILILSLLMLGVAHLIGVPVDHSSFLVAFGFLGGITGLIAGVSQQPIVDALLTGMLGIISALLTYLLGRESLSNWRPVIPLALILLLISTLAGLSIGGSYKAKKQEFDRSYQRRMLLYQKVDLEVCKLERQMLLEGKKLPADYRPVSCPKN